MRCIPCCEKDNVRRGQWTPEEDKKLSSYVAQHGTRNWRLIPKNAGLQRCGKSCRLRWSVITTAQLRGRIDNDVKNHWNTKLKKRLSGMGIDPVTHKSFSHLMAEISTTLAPPQVAHLAEAALGCFKDEMLHLLTKKRIDSHLQRSAAENNKTTYITSKHEEKDDTVEKTKLNLSTAIQESEMLPSNTQPWDPAWAISANFADACNAFLGSVSGFRLARSHLVMTGLHHHGARVCELEAHARQASSKVGCMRK